VCRFEPGELALMYGSPRNASIVAKTEMKLYELHRDAFRFVMVDTAQSGSEKLISFLRKVELLKGMNDRDLGRLSEALEPVSYTDGQTIITEGDTVADYFYIIERGTVVVSSEGEEVVRRHEGEYFGELALLKNVARIATVTAAGDDVVLLQLSRQKFQTLFGTIGSGTDWAARYEKEAQEQEEAAQQTAPTGSELSGTVTRDDFTIMQTLGFGAYGRVQLVKSKQNGKIYAMKILMKRHILDKKQVQHTKDEKRVIEKLNHPFVVNMVAAFQDDFNLYLVLEFVNGGELYSLLQNQGKLSEPWARLYIGELALAFYYFSQLHIVYRDLKPENLLIDAGGHMKITDFGLAKEVTSRTYTMCGTPDYLAPEIIKNSGHGRGVDYWALGVVCFEMLTGLPPFYQADGRSEQTLQRILKEKPKFPASFPREARSFVMALLERDSSKRLGCLENGVQDIMTHPWFATTDWQVRRVASRRIALLAYVMRNDTVPTLV
jgi:CRP-like cAMP-binding protein/tRNA A-37 threonylcarbamoyl transferase component Bud32